MRHFATESGKSKGQFYTPAEVSRIMAKVIGIGSAKRSRPDHLRPDLRLWLAAAEGPRRGQGPHRPGPGHLRAGDGQRHRGVGQDEHDPARLPDGGNLAGQHPLEPALQGPDWRPQDVRLRGGQSAVLHQGVEQRLRPGATIVTAASSIGIPPAKNGDYAFLLHLLTSLKSTGKGAIILPHGVLFRGDAEADIRESIVRGATSRASSACPPTCSTAPAFPPASSCSTRRTPQARKGIFMIDASKGFMKDGNKNRLRAQDIHKIVDAFTRQLEIPRYSRMVPLAEMRGQRLQPEHPALHRQHRAGGPAGHRRPPARRHPQPRHRCAGPLLARSSPACGPLLFEPADRPGYSRLKVASRRRSRPPSSAIPSSPRSTSQ